MRSAAMMASPAAGPLPSGGSGEEDVVGGGERVDWAALIPHLIHPTKVIIIEALLWLERPMSATELEKVAGADPPLSDFSHHLNQIAKMSVLEVVEKRKIGKGRGGKRATFFYFSRGRK